MIDDADRPGYNEALSVSFFTKKRQACCQTVLPDRSILIGQKLSKNAKIQKFK